MSGIAGNQRDLSIRAWPYDGEVGRFDNPSGSDKVTKPVIATGNENIISVTQAMNVAEEAVAMAGDHGISRGSRFHRFRHVGRSKHQGALRNSFEHDVFELDSGDGKFGESLGYRRIMRIPLPQQ